MVFGNGIKNIQAAAYNGARTVVEIGVKDYKTMTKNIRLFAATHSLKVW